MNYRELAGPRLSNRRRASAVELPWHHLVIALLVMPTLMLMSSALSSCAGTIHRTPTQNGHIAINAATHVLRTIDTGLTARYQQLAPSVPDAQLAAFEVPYDRAIAAERLALDSLTTAERAVNDAALNPTASTQCTAGTLVLRARDLVTDVLNLARAFGLVIDAATVSTIATLEQIASALVPSCGSAAP